MKIKKLPTQLTDQELLEAMESEDTQESVRTEVLESHNDVVPFLSHYNIIPGNLSVKKQLLFKLYKTYSKEPVEVNRFHRVVGEFLEPRYNHLGKFYKINKDAFTVSNHIFQANNKTTIKKTHSLTYRKHFETFLSNKNIKPGNVWFQGYLIHEIYKEYCIEMNYKRVKLGYENFCKFLRIYFKHKRATDSRGLWYMVNIEATTILKEEEKNGFIEEKRRNSGKKANKKQERMEQRPSSFPETEG